MRRVRALEEKARAAEEIAREARARAARLDAVVNEASHAAKLVDAARQRQEADLDRVRHEASRAADTSLILDQHLFNIHDSIRRDRARALRKQSVAEAMALTHRSTLCSRELDQAVSALHVARSQVSEGATQLLVAVDAEEATLLCALRQHWASVRDQIREAVEGCDQSNDVAISSLQHLGRQITESKAAIHSVKALVREMDADEQTLLDDVGMLRQHEENIKSALSQAQTLLATPPALLTHELCVDASVHDLIPQLLSRCVTVAAPHTPPSPARRAKIDLPVSSSDVKLSEELTRILDQPAPSTVRAASMSIGSLSNGARQGAIRANSPARTNSPPHLTRAKTPPMHWPAAEEHMDKLMQLPHEIALLASSLRATNPAHPPLTTSASAADAAMKSVAPAEPSVAVAAAPTADREQGRTPDVAQGQGHGGRGGGMMLSASMLTNVSSYSCDNSSSEGNEVVSDKSAARTSGIVM